MATPPSTTPNSRTVNSTRKSGTPTPGVVRGSDGAKGLKALRGKGHYTIAQDQASSAVYGMPKAAVALDAAVDILPLGRIAARLVDTFTYKL